jgi:TRAP-type uncharacterized transport system fused permease subunit
METSVQAWKYAKGLYLIPLFMVFNPQIILGGPLPMVLWGGAIAIVALAAFAAVLEGFLFRPIAVWTRVLLLPCVVAVFWPNLIYEIVGFVLILVLLGMNWVQARREKALPDGPPWLKTAADT